MIGWVGVPMSKISILSFVVVIAGSGLLLAGSATSQSGMVKNLVILQPVTPGISQSGHVNVSGLLNGGQVNGDSANAGVGSVRGVNSSTASNSAGVQGTASGLSGQVYGGRFHADSISGTGVYATSTGTYGIRGSSTGSAGATYGGFFEALGPDGIAVSGNSLSATGNTWGGSFFANSADGIGVEGKSNGATGVLGSSSKLTGITAGGKFVAASSGGYGVWGIASSTTGTTTGGRFEATASTGGFGVVAIGNQTGIAGASNVATGSTAGGIFSSASTAGRGVSGSATATTGTTYGGLFASSSSAGYGVYCLAGSTTGSGVGGYFESFSTSGTGIEAVAVGQIAVRGDNNGTNFSASYGGFFTTESSSGVGVQGINVNSGAANTPYGVRGQASTATNGFGVFASGDLGASGVKPFRIDHPADPANKYLLHYSSESPFPQNFYNGTVTTDEKGMAWVDLPDYFEEINTNFKYTLTVIEDEASTTFVQAKVGRKIKNNRFLVMTSAPHTEVSWEVKADRNDLRIQHNRPTDVREKTGSERGKYQHPEYYGLSEEMSISYVQKRKKD